MTLPRKVYNSTGKLLKHYWMKPIFKKFRTLDQGCARRGRCENPQGGAKKHMNQLTRSYFYILGQIPLRFCKSSLYICYNRFPITAQPRLWISTNHPSLPYSLHFPHVKSNMCILHRKLSFHVRFSIVAQGKPVFRAKLDMLSRGTDDVICFFKFILYWFLYQAPEVVLFWIKKNITQINFGELPWLHSKSEILILGA